MKNRRISAFDAKTHLSQLLRETEAGRSYTICRRGKPVALLSPVQPQARRDLKTVVADAARLRESIRRRLKGTINVRELIEEGRRH